MIAPASLTALPRTGGDLMLNAWDTLEEIPAFAGMSGYKYACNPALTSKARGAVAAGECQRSATSTLMKTP